MTEICGAGRGRRDAGGLSWGKAESLKQNALVLAERGLVATFLRLAMAYMLRARHCLERFFRLVTRPCCWQVAVEKLKVPQKLPRSAAEQRYHRLRLEH